MQTHNDLLISLNGYYYSPEYDDFALRSLAGQSDHNFSVLFIDPYTLEERKNKINNFSDIYNIECLYLPYQKDHNARAYDWTTRNLACLFTPDNGRFFNLWQNRMVNTDIVKYINKERDKNLGFVRNFQNTNINNFLYPIETDCTISYAQVGLPHEYIANFSSQKSSFTVPESIITPQYNANSLDYCAYDCCLRTDDFLTLNGTDEALTAMIYNEDWDIETRWRIANSKGVLHELVYYPHMMMYFYRGSRKEYQTQHVSSQDKCVACQNNYEQWIGLINTDVMEIDGLDYIGDFFDGLWFKCATCGQPYLKVGRDWSNWESMSRRASGGNYLASIGIDGRYGRELSVLRADVQSAKNWDDAVQVINGSWKNPKYYIYPKEIPGFFDFEEVYDKVIAEAPEHSKIVEVGCLFGKSTQYLLEKSKNKDLDIYAIDIWPAGLVSLCSGELRSQHPYFIEWINKNINSDAFKIFQNNTKQYKFNILIENSITAVNKFKNGSIFFVLLDNDHAYEHLIQEIPLWFEKISPDGYIAGHDWHMDGVRAAVLKYFKIDDIIIFNRDRASSWMVKKSMVNKLLDCTD